MEGRERAGKDGEGNGDGKRREGSTWIFVQGLQVPSYATALTTRHQRDF